MNARISFACLFACLIAAHSISNPDPRTEAREIFASAVEAHRTMSDLPYKVTVTLDRSMSEVSQVGDSSPASVERAWRYECTFDTLAGVAISKNLRKSDKLNGVERIDMKRPITASRLCPDCKVDTLRFQMGASDPRFSVIEPMMEEDSVLVHPLDSLNSVNSVATQDFLSGWASSSMNAEGCEISVTTTDPKHPLVRFDYGQVGASYAFTFQQDGSRYLFLSLQKFVTGSDGPIATSKLGMEYATFGASDGKSFTLPTRSYYSSNEGAGTSSRELAALDWKLEPRPTDAGEYRAMVAGNKEAGIRDHLAATREAILRKKMEQQKP